MTIAILISLLTLTFMEIVLGIDNLIFISLTTDKLPEHQQGKARVTGLSLALIIRILLLFSITWIIGMTEPLFTVFDYSASWRDLILIGGGLFLLAKSTSDLHEKMEGEHEEHVKTKKAVFGKVIIQIVLLDIVFSFDSILTAIGLSDQILIMVIAIVISMVIMLLSAAKISAFINKHPTIKVLALSFLLLIGFMLVLEGLHFEIPKGYIYFAIFFSLFVEMINIRIRKSRNK
jgi:predicted tellurium resistance membrane protein TerC